MSSCMDVVFCHEVIPANSTADVLAKQGLDRVSPWVACIL